MKDKVEEHTKATIAAATAFEANDVKSWHFRLGTSNKWGLRFNPVTTFASIVIIWGFIAWCIAQPAEVRCPAPLALPRHWSIRCCYGMAW